MNLEIANIFREIAYILEMGVTEKDGEDQKSKLGLIFKIRSYKKAADVIENLYTEVDELYKTEKINGLLKLPSVGKAIALKIEEYVLTGKIHYYEDLKKVIPVNVSELMNLEGIGPKTIMTLYSNLKIQDIAELENAARGGRIRSIAGFSQKREEAILKKIQFFRKGKERRLIGEIYPLVKEIESRLANVSGIKHAVAAGSFRRMRETIGDVDFLVSTSAEGDNSTKTRIIDYFINMPEVREIVGKGAAKAFVKLKNGMDADLLVVPEESFGGSITVFHWKQRTWRSSSKGSPF